MTLLDTTRRVETPEGIELELRTAGPVPRALAWALDLLIRVGIYLAAALVLSFLGGIGFGAVLLGGFLLEWFYPVVFEVLRQGQTPGKKVLRLRVLRRDGAPVGWTHAMVRSLVMAADFLPFLYLSGLASMLLSRDFQRLGDLAAGTVVVHTESPAAGAARQEAPPEPVPAALSLEEQRALVAFADRAGALTSERAQELGDLLAPLTGAQGATGVRRLLGFAATLAGRGRAGSGREGRP